MINLTAGEVLAVVVNAIIVVGVPTAVLVFAVRLYRKVNRVERKVDRIERELEQGG